MTVKFRYITPFLSNNIENDRVQTKIFHALYLPISIFLYLIGILDSTSRCSIKLVNLLSVSVFSLSVRVREGMILSLIQRGKRE